ncbi:MAG: DNA repair protein RadA [Candidatus Komeilibacteria bacterium]
MTNKNVTIFACSKCGAQYPKWTGRCLECGSWGTVTEENSSPAGKVEQKIDNKRAQAPVALSTLTSGDLSRISSGFSELDRVLGGGLISGSMILLGGDPGIGKSTLALQLAGNIKEALYVSAEESGGQVSQRWQRLGKGKDIKFLNSNNLEDIIATISKEKPSLVVIDSIQTIYSEVVSGEAGNISQVRACTVQLLSFAKQLDITIVIIGHVTKEGVMAGPKTLEHLVDTVLYLEGDKYQQYRLLRAVKNRFGQTGEVALWEMAAKGLQQITNPSALLWSDKKVAGAVGTAMVEGSRVLLVEVQALVNKTSFGYPRRLASGFSNQRLEVILAVLAKKLKLPLSNYDVYINIAGGLQLREPALDLAVAAAIMSAYYDKPFPSSSIIFGEIGLSGELRAVVKTKSRVKEALRLGVERVYLPTLPKEVRANKQLMSLADLSAVVKLFK